MKPTLRSGLTELTNDGSTLATNNQLNAKFERSNLAPVDDSGRQFSATAQTAVGRCNRLHEEIAMSRSELLLFATEPARAGDKQVSLLSQRGHGAVHTSANRSGCTWARSCTRAATLACIGSRRTAG